MVKNQSFQTSIRISILALLWISSEAACSSGSSPGTLQLRKIYPGLLLHCLIFKGNLLYYNIYNDINSQNQSKLMSFLCKLSFHILHQPLQSSFPHDSQVTRVDVIDQKDYLPFLPQSWFSNDPIVQDTHVLLGVTWAEWSLSIKTWLVQEEHMMFHKKRMTFCHCIKFV